MGRGLAILISGIVIGLLIFIGANEKLASKRLDRLTSKRDSIKEVVYTNLLDGNKPDSSLLYKIDSLSIIIKEYE